jgi:hypothetical protein
MDALSRPTVFTHDEARDIQNDLDRAISALLALRAAYDQDQVFACQNPDGERASSANMLAVSKAVTEAHDELQQRLLSRVSSHIGAPSETFAIKDVRGGNDALEDVRTEYAERIESGNTFTDYRPAHTDHLRVANGGLV